MSYNNPSIIIYNKCITILITLILLVGFHFDTRAAINEELIFQGKLQNSDGTNVSDGAYDMIFKIYTTAEGGTAIYTETWNNTTPTTFSSTINDTTPPLTSDNYPLAFTYTDHASESTLKVGQTLYNLTQKDRVEITAFDTTANTITITKVGVNWANGDSITTRPMIKDGIFSVRIGSLNPDTNNLLTAIASYLNQDLWLGVQVGTDSEMRPRKKLGSVPWALATAKLAGQYGETIDNATDDLIRIIGSGGTTDTDLYINLDGAYPTLYSQTHTQIGFDDDLVFVGPQTISTSSDVLTIQTGASAGADDIIFQLAGAEKMRILENGNLFFEKGTYDTTLAITTPTANRTITFPDAEGTIALGTGTANYAAYWSATNTLAAEQYLSVSRGGTGSGTFTQYGVLYGNATSALGVTAAGATNQVLIGNTGAAPSWGTIGAGHVTPDSLDFTEFKDALTLDANLTISASASNYSIDIDSGTLFVDTANNSVGIGTTNPGSWKLNVAGGIYASTGIQTGWFQGNSNAVVTYPYSYTSSDALIVYGNTGSAWAERMRVTAAGDVGIGTTAPQGKLQVGADTGDNTNTVFLSGDVRITSYESDVAYLQARETGATNVSLQLRTQNAGSVVNVMRLTNTGDVGIGTTSPGAKLDVRGHVFLGGSDSNRQLKITDGWTSYPDGTDGAEISVDAGSFKALMIVGSDQDNTDGRCDNLRCIRMWDRVTVEGELYSTGNVGIGTTSPGAKLTVHGDSSGQSLAFFRSDADTADLTITTSATWQAPILKSGGGDALGLNVNGSSTPSVFINSSGDVGIGTTGPGARLDVRGSADVADFYDSGANLVLEINEASSPIYWEQSLASQFQEGILSQTDLDWQNDHILLAKNSSGNYYSTGTYTTVIHDTKGISEIDNLRVISIIPESTSIIAHLEVSDDNFATIKDSVSFELQGTRGIEEFDPNSLAIARYIRVRFDFRTNNPSVSPRLSFIDVWYYVLESIGSLTFFNDSVSLSDLATNNLVTNSNFNSSPLRVIETSDASANYIPKMLDDHLITNSIIYELNGMVGIEGIVSVSGDLNIGSRLCLNNTCLTEEQLATIVQSLNPDGTAGPEVSVEQSWDINFLENLAAGLEKLGLVIKDGIAKAKELIAEKIAAKKLCLEDETGETVCIDKSQLQSLLQGANQTQEPNADPTQQITTAAPLPSSESLQTTINISNISVSEISHNSVKITWQTDEESNSVVEYGLQAGPPYDITISGDAVAEGDVFLHTVWLTELESNTLYHFRVDSASADQTFTTLPPPQPLPAPEPVVEQPAEETPATASEPLASDTTI